MNDFLDAEFFTLKLADGWRSRRNGCQYTLSALGEGAPLEIASSKVNTPLTKEDLRYFNRETIEDGHVPEEVRLGDFMGLAFSYIEDEIYWFHWDLVHDRLWLQIGFDCKVSDRDIKAAAITRMLASLKVRDNAI